MNKHTRAVLAVFDRYEAAAHRARCYKDTYLVMLQYGAPREAVRREYERYRKEAETARRLAARLHAMCGR